MHVLYIAGIIAACKLTGMIDITWPEYWGTVLFVECGVGLLQSFGPKSDA